MRYVRIAMTDGHTGLSTNDRDAGQVQQGVSPEYYGEIPKVEVTPKILPHVVKSFVELHQLCAPAPIVARGDSSVFLVAIHAD
jgi:hypothetical protein